MKKPCITEGCDRLKLPGNGQRYCPDCRIEYLARRKAKTLQDIHNWHAEDYERSLASQRAHYQRNAEQARARSRAWYHANKDRARERMVKRRARVGPEPKLGKYGLTRADYKRMLDQQNHACAICRRTENGKRHFFDVDHDHATGIVRGLLCNRCNRMLSNALDSPALLEAAISYLAAAPQEACA